MTPTQKATAALNASGGFAVGVPFIKVECVG